MVESWTALYQRTRGAGICPNNLAPAVWGESIRQLLARGAVMYVAVNPEMPDHWLGGLLVEQTHDGVPVVHLSFVKSLYRADGVLDDLFAQAGIDRTRRLFYTTAVGSESRLYPAGRFTPELARRRTA